MSVIYCFYCDLQIDTDLNAEHFTSDGETCMTQAEEDITEQVLKDSADKILLGETITKEDIKKEIERQLDELA